jgi:hypothetical protein
LHAKIQADKHGNISKNQLLCPWEGSKEGCSFKYHGDSPKILVEHFLEKHHGIKRFHCVACGPTKRFGVVQELEAHCKDVHEVLHRDSVKLFFCVKGKVPPLVAKALKLTEDDVSDDETYDLSTVPSGSV